MATIGGGDEENQKRTREGEQIHWPRAGRGFFQAQPAYRAEDSPGQVDINSLAGRFLPTAIRRQVSGAVRKQSAVRWPVKNTSGAAQA